MVCWVTRDVARAGERGGDFSNGNASPRVLPLDISTPVIKRKARPDRIKMFMFSVRCARPMAGLWNAERRIQRLFSDGRIRIKYLWKFFRPTEINEMV